MLPACCQLTAVTTVNKMTEQDMLQVQHHFWHKSSLVRPVTSCQRAGLAKLWGNLCQLVGKLFSSFLITWINLWISVSDLLMALQLDYFLKNNLPTVPRVVFCGGGGVLKTTFAGKEDLLAVLKLQKNTKIDKYQTFSIWIPVPQGT